MPTANWSTVMFLAIITILVLNVFEIIKLYP